MAGNDPPQVQLGATFTPGGFDDFYMPENTGVLSPAPQRVNHEIPGQIQDGIQAMELDSTTRNTTSPQSDTSPSSFYSPHPNAKPQPLFNDRQLPQHQPSQQQQQQQYQPQPSQQQQESPQDRPNFSGFPKLRNRTPNVPPSDEEKEQTLETARVPVLSSTDVEMQLQWAQDTLSYVDVAAEYAQRMSLVDGARPSTPRIEHQLRTDAVNIVAFMADQHHPKAEFMKGIWLEFGKFGYREDKTEAFRCYRRSAERGYARAEYRMGMQYESTNEPSKAIHHYQTGAAAGDSASNYRMGMIFLLGQLGQAQDLSKGVQLIRYAADTADENAPQGAYVYGMLQAKDLPQISVPDHIMPRDLIGARTLIEKSAFLGFSKAQLKMGSCYELAALGCDFDPVLSLHYNALAAKQGEPEAELAISKWFLCGQEDSFAKNDELAYKYAQRASQSGLPAADFAMGYFSEVGIYVKSDLELAKRFYQKAASQGNKDASERLTSISASNVMSKSDHENIAINRIKSTHASMRGQRPQRLGKPLEPLPTVQDSPEPRYSSPRPPRSSSVTPYPDDRASTVTPYPDGNYHQTNQTPAPNKSFFVADDRLGPQQPRPYGAPGPASQPLRPYQSVTNMAQGPQQPLRQYQSVNDMAAGRGRPPPGAYHQPPAPIRPPKDLGPQASSTPPPAKLNIGYSAPPDPRIEQKNQLKQQPVPQRPGHDSRISVSSISSASTPRPSHSPRPSGDRISTQPASRPDPRSKTPQPPPTSTTAPTRPPGKGPKTFEEMGVPVGKAESDCCVM